MNAMTPLELKEARIRLGFTQEKLAVELGVVRKSLNRWEAGKHRIPLMVELALKQLESEHYDAPPAAAFLRGHTKKFASDELNIVDKQDVHRPKAVSKSDHAVEPLQAESKQLSLELQRILWACFTYWNSDPNPVDERVFCYSWIIWSYKAKFGETFNQIKLCQLARLGLLAKDGASHCGTRRYYRINDPVQLAQFLKDCQLDPGPSPDLAPVSLPNLTLPGRL
jgi:transcriptional regulator with XRE-family HTH domain